MSEDADPIVSPGPSVYKSYLLRVWRDATVGAPWRARLESVTEPDERQNFSDVESLVGYLLATFDGDLGTSRKEGHQA